MTSAAPMQPAEPRAGQVTGHGAGQAAARPQHGSTGAARIERVVLPPLAAAHRQLQAAADQSPQSAELRSFHRIAQDSARALQLRAMHAGMQARDLTPTETSEAPKPNHTALPDQLKSGIESLSGVSMDHLKVHYNSARPAQLHAHAYAQGNEIHLAPGQEQHLPHEAWHVVQQAQGRVRPTTQAHGQPINDDVGLEAEADVMGARGLAQGATLQEKSNGTTPLHVVRLQADGGEAPAAIQRVVAQILPRLAYEDDASSDSEADVDEMGAEEEAAMDDGTREGGNDVVIGRVAIVGRPDSPYSGTMGDHSTAYTALQVGLETRLNGLTFHQAGELLSELSYELCETPGWRLVENMPWEQEVLADTAWQTLEEIIDYFRARREDRHREPDGAEVGRMQEFIEAYLQFHEYLPLSTINTRFLGAATAGKGKGETAYALANAESAPGSASAADIKAAVLSLFDPRTAALVSWIGDQETMNRVAPGLLVTTTSEERIDMMIDSHLSLMESLYPEATDKLKQRDESGNADILMEEKKEDDEADGPDLWTVLGADLHAAVSASILQLQSSTVVKKPKNTGRGSNDGKRYAAASVFVDEGRVVAVKIAGRPISPFSGTMGAHTTAFVVYKDLIESQLRGKSLAGASARLLELMGKAREDLAASLRIFPADDKQFNVINRGLGLLQEIEGALGEIQEAGNVAAVSENGEEQKTMEREDAQADGSMSEWDQVLLLQEGIVRLVDILNSTPGATLDIADINGKREGAHRALLMTSENPVERKKAVLGLLDMAGIGDYLETSWENIDDEDPTGERDAYFEKNRGAYPDEDVMPDASGDEKSAQLHIMRHHLAAISLAYPDQMHGTGLEGELDDDTLMLLVVEALALRNDEAEYLAGDDEDDDD